MTMHALTRAHGLPSPSEMLRELTESDAARRAAADLAQIADLERRSAALMQISKDLRAIHIDALDAMNSDSIARASVDAVVSSAIDRLDASDDDLSCRLAEMLKKIDAFELSGISFDARHRSYHVDMRIDTIKTRRAAAARAAARDADAYKAKQAAKRSAYTVAYEAAMKLTAAQHRQLSEALMKS